MTKEDILELLHRAQALGLSSIEIEGLKAQFGPRPVSHEPVSEFKAEDLVKPLSILDEYTEDEILYWATPYGQELEAKKAKQLEDGEPK